MPNQNNFVTLRQWCEENGRQDFLDLWDYELNDTTPETIAHMSTKKVWLKCQRGLHESSHVVLQSVIKAYKKGKEYKYCGKCNSFGMYVIDTYGQDYLDSIWSDKNEISPFDIAQRSQVRIWLRCQNDDTHPDYDIVASNFQISHNCPYCSGKRVCETNSFGYVYNDYMYLWSDKNENSPFDYTHGSNSEAWFKCPDGIHGDYRRKIAATIQYNFRCPECSRITLWGEYYKNTNKELNHKNYIRSVERFSPEMRKWRENAIERDNGTCQCCGSTEMINVHHIENFSSNIELRANDSNSICLCYECHSVKVRGSFHNVYGSSNNNAQQLEEYINNRRKQLGILIPFTIDEYKRGNILKPNDVEIIKAFFEEWNFIPYCGIVPVSDDEKFVKIKSKFRINKEE